MVIMTVSLELSRAIGSGYSKVEVFCRFPCSHGPVGSGGHQLAKLFCSAIAGDVLLQSEAFLLFSMHTGLLTVSTA